MSKHDNNDELNSPQSNQCIVLELPDVEEKKKEPAKLQKVIEQESSGGRYSSNDFHVTTLEEDKDQRYSSNDFHPATIGDEDQNNAYDDDENDQIGILQTNICQ